MISFSSLSKRRGATLAGVFSLAFSCVALLCGAGSAPIENLLPQGAMQGDLNAGGHSLTNAATVSATNVVVSGALTAPSSFTLPFSKLTGTPTSLSGYGIADPVVLTSGSYANPSWITSLAYSKLTGAPSAYTLPVATTSVLGGVKQGANVTIAGDGTISVAAPVTSLAFSAITSTPTTLSGYGITDAAPLASPAFTGTPTGPTATTGTNTTQLATTAFVLANAGSLTVDSTVTTVGFSFTSGTLYLSNVNAEGGLAQLVSSDGTADGSIAFLGTTDDGSGSVAIGVGSSAINGSAAIGNSAGATDGGGAVGDSSTATSGAAVGYYARESEGGGAVGNNAHATYGGAMGVGATETDGGGAVGNGAQATQGGASGVGATETDGGGAVGNGAQATSGFAGGNNTYETGGGANFCGGSYAGTGIAVGGDEIALVNGSGYALLSGLDDSTTPTNTVTPVGWMHVHVNGVDSWIPYYR